MEPPDEMTPSAPGRRRGPAPTAGSRPAEVSTPASAHALTGLTEPGTSSTGVATPGDFATSGTAGTPRTPQDVEYMIPPLGFREATGTVSASSSAKKTKSQIAKLKLKIEDAYPNLFLEFTRANAKRMALDPDNAYLSYPYLENKKVDEFTMARMKAALKRELQKEFIVTGSDAGVGSTIKRMFPWFDCSSISFRHLRDWGKRTVIADMKHEYTNERNYTYLAGLMQQYPDVWKGSKEEIQAFLSQRFDKNLCKLMLGGAANVLDLDAIFAKPKSKAVWYLRQVFLNISLSNRHVVEEERGNAKNANLLEKWKGGKTPSGWVKAQDKRTIVGEVWKQFLIDDDGKFTKIEMSTFTWTAEPEPTRPETPSQPAEPKKRDASQIARDEMVVEDCPDSSPEGSQGFRRSRQRINSPQQDTDLPPAPTQTQSQRTGGLSLSDLRQSSPFADDDGPTLQSVNVSPSGTARTPNGTYVNRAALTPRGTHYYAGRRQHHDDDLERRMHPELLQHDRHAAGQDDEDVYGASPPRQTTQPTPATRLTRRSAASSATGTRAVTQPAWNSGQGALTGTVRGRGRGVVRGNTVRGAGQRTPSRGRGSGRGRGDGSLNLRGARIAIEDVMGLRLDDSDSDSTVAAREQDRDMSPTVAHLERINKDRANYH